MEIESLNTLIINWWKDYSVYINTTADLLSIVTFLFTIYVFFGVKKIKAGFLLQARLPQLQKVLEENASSISEKMRTFPKSRTEILGVLAVTIGTVEHIQKILPKTTSIRTLKNKIEKEKNNNDLSKDNAWTIYRQMLEASQSIIHILEDKKWSR